MFQLWVLGPDSWQMLTDPFELTDAANKLFHILPPQPILSGLLDLLLLLPSVSTSTFSCFPHISSVQSPRLFLLLTYCLSALIKPFLFIPAVRQMLHLLQSFRDHPNGKQSCAPLDSDSSYLSVNLALIVDSLVWSFLFFFFHLCLKSSPLYCILAALSTAIRRR